jgi:hypothetical protein
MPVATQRRESRSLLTNDSSTKRDISSEVNISSNGQMFQVNDPRDLRDPSLKLMNLSEVVA